ncbi:hypothetical protein [Pseudonocardia sp.]|uniref:hypothetical protein n=1 Tax=Pseudonocardia sp. TaxID=60912 RepID=UPI003D10B604
MTPGIAQTTDDLVSAAEEVAAAIGGALSTGDVPAPLAETLRHLREDLLETLGETAPPLAERDERPAARIVAMGRALGTAPPGTEDDLGGTSAAGSWLRLARAFARRGGRSAPHSTAARTYLTEVGTLLVLAAAEVDEHIDREQTCLALQANCAP